MGTAGYWALGPHRSFAWLALYWPPDGGGLPSQTPVTAPTYDFPHQSKSAPTKNPCRNP